MKIGKLTVFLEKTLFSENYTRPILLIGESGIGKTQIPAQMALERKMEVVHLRPALQEPGDLIGLPQIKDGLTIWAKPCWWPQPETPTLIIIDEVNRGPIDVRQAMFQLVEQHRLHTHFLNPKIHRIIACINPNNMNYQVEELDPAFKRRFIPLNVEADLDAWINWAYKNKIDENVIQFLITQPNALLGEPKTDEGFPNPANWELVSDILKSKLSEEEGLFEITSNILGKAIAAVFLKYMKEKFERAITGKEIIEKYKEVKEKFLAQSIEMKVATITDFIALAKDIKDKKIIQRIIEVFNDLNEKDLKVTLLKKLDTKLRDAVLKENVVSDEMIKLLFEK